MLNWGCKMKNRKKLKSDNHGVTLLEIIVAVIILALFMVPLLRHFVVAARINSKMDKVRSVEVTSESIIESLKCMRINKILKQFQLDDGGNISGLKDFSIIPLYGSDYLASAVYRMEPLDDKITYDEAHALETAADGKYAFMIDNMEIGARCYDVLIHLNSNVYKAGGAAPVEKQYDEYLLPKMAELDASSVAIIDTQRKLGLLSCDEYAVQEFKNRNNAYITEINNRNQLLQEEYNDAMNHYNEEVLMGKNPTEPQAPTYETVPTAVEDSVIRNNIVKETKIEVMPSGSNIRAKATVKYTLPDTIQIGPDISEDYQIVEKDILNEEYAQKIDYMYLLYTPTQFTKEKEKITINNGQSISLNTYMIKQITTPVGGAVPAITNSCIIKKDPSSQPINIYSNMKYDNSDPDNSEYTLDGFVNSDVKGKVEKEKDPNNWIYQIDVNVYEHDTVNRYSELIYSVSSTAVE